MTSYAKVIAVLILLALILTGLWSWIYELTRPSTGWLDFREITALIIGVFGVLLTACTLSLAMAVRRRFWRFLAIPTFLLDIGVFNVACVYFLLDQIDDEIIGALAVLAIGVSWSGLVVVPDVPRRFATFQHVIGACGIAMTFCISTLTLLGWPGSDMWWIWAILSFGTVTTTSAFALSIIVLVHELRRARVDEAQYVALTCPSCGQHGEFALGEISCTGCGLGMRVEITGG